MYLGRAQAVTGQVTEAGQSLRRALAIFTELGDDSRTAEIQSELASLPRGPLND
jgi:hypothetical protein